MKKNKKVLIILGVAILLIVLITTSYVLLTTPDKDTTLTAPEKRWVEQNKNKVINVAVLNDIPVYGYEGSGLFFDYIDDFEKDIELSFNKVSYNYGDNPSLYEYKFEITEEVKDNQILFYNDYYVALSKNDIRLDGISDLSELNIGTLERKKDDVNFYLADSKANIIAEKTEEDLFKKIENDEVDTILIPYTMYLDKILENNYNIIYNFKDISDKYVLTLNDTNTTVNNIMKKYFDLWKNSNYLDSYNSHYKSLYFSNKKISTKQQADFKGRIYTYGYVENTPYENIVNDNLVGINGELLSGFGTLGDIEIRYKKYNSIDSLKQGFNNGDVDIMFNNFAHDDEISNSISSPSIYNEEYVVLVNVNNNFVMDSARSLKNETVYILKNSLISDYIRRTANPNIQTFENYNKLFNNLKDDMIIVMDYDTYNYYKNNELSKYIVIYKDKLNYDYNFILRDSKNNKVFNELFSFYISSLNYDKIRNNAYQKLIINPNNETLPQTIMNYILFIVLPVIIIIGLLIYLVNRRRKQNTIKKDEKLKYIDMLTSLKNRNYLNSNIPKWDEGKIYPQAIVVIDLNNVKYINDNFGHEEGDNLIKAAANILIKTQLENSDIIRTDGNEFLIYLIGYEEDNIISYMRKLYKEMKELPHGFGAALGYSMILDETKVVDDAINEATLDMRTNKEA